MLVFLFSCLVINLFRLENLFGNKSHIFSVDKIQEKKKEASDYSLIENFKIKRPMFTLV